MRLFCFRPPISWYHWITTLVITIPSSSDRRYLVQGFDFPSTTTIIHQHDSQVRNVQCLFANNNEHDNNSGYDIQAASAKLVWERLEASRSRPVLDLSSRDESPEDSIGQKDDSTEEWKSGQRWHQTNQGLQDLGISLDEIDFLAKCPQLLRLDTQMILDNAKWIVQEFGVDYFKVQPSAPKLLSYRHADVQYGIEFMSTMMMQNAKSACQGSSDFFVTAVDGGIQEQSVKNALRAAGDATYQANQRVVGDAMSSLQSLKKNRKRL